MWNRHEGSVRKIGTLALAAGVLLSLPALVGAQAGEPLAVRPDGAGARAIALGEAYYALGGDYYSLYYNPAGIGLARGTRVDGGIAHRTSRISTRYFGNDSAVDIGSTGLDALGMTYAFPVERGNLVFAVGAHRVRDLDARYRVEGFNTTADSLIGETWVFSQDTDRGSIYAYSIGVAVEAAEGFLVGASLEAISGSNSYNFLLDATDTDAIWVGWDGIIRDDGIEYTYRSKGLRLGLGGLWQPAPALSVGGSIRLPSRVKVTEDWYEFDEQFFDDGTSSITWDENGVFSYEFELPAEFGFGAAFSAGALKLMGGGLLVDYRDSEYSVAPYDGYDLNFFLDNYVRRWRWSGGVEVTAPNGYALRAGYQWAPILFQPLSREITRNREIFSVGLGIPFDRSLRMDVAYRYSTWDAINWINAVDGIREEHRNGQFFISFGYRF